MKKLLLFVMMLVVLVSCETEDAETAECVITFNVEGDFLNPLFQTRAASDMTADGAEMLDMWLIDYKDGEIRQEMHQTNTDTDWGKPTMSLTLGTHHVLFLASRGLNPEYQSGVVTWEKPLDTFYKDYEVTVVKNSDGNRSVSLDRVTTKLVLNIEDAIPAGTTELRVLPAIWFTGYDMLSGEPVANTEYEQIFSIPASWQGRKGASLTSWSLSSASEWTTDIHYTSMAGTAKNGEITILSAPFKANRATTYRGNFYTSQSESSVTLNDEWLPDYEGVY